ncbi:MAG: ComEC/Rec2 family competence protein [Lachnospiraceae bacterium]|nr:ComEC/Rec2 family competence protein [Lachnospiraceae bacterium]
MQKDSEGKKCSRFHRKSLGMGLLCMLAVLGLTAGIAGSATGEAGVAEAAPKVSEQTGTLEVHFLDVGQADSTLLLCDGHAMLIDCGTEDKGTAIQNYLQKRGIRQLDYLVLTHPDSDHIGGAAVVVTKFDIGKTFVSNYEKSNSTYKKLIKAMDNKDLKGITPKVGSSYTLGSAKFTILAPNDTYEDPNNASVALRIVYGKNSFLFTGDAEEEAEQDILTNKKMVKSDVYQVGHHGSNTSTSDDFLEAVAPKYAVISCGEGNSYGHPRAETLNKLRAAGVQVFRTDEQGVVVATSDGKNITWNMSPSETWKAGEPAGKEKNDTAPATSNFGTGNDNVAATTTTYILNQNTKKFHKPGCSSAKKIAEKNYAESTESRDALIGQGYDPCKNCNP